MSWRASSIEVVFPVTLIPFCQLRKKARLSKKRGLSLQRKTEIFLEKTFPPEKTHFPPLFFQYTIFLFFVKPFAESK